MLESPCANLDEVRVGVTSMAKEFEQDFVDDELHKRKDLDLIKSSTNTSNHARSATYFLVKQHRVALKEGIHHSIMHFSCQVDNNIGSIKFFSKSKTMKMKVSI